MQNDKEYTRATYTIEAQLNEHHTEDPIQEGANAIEEAVNMGDNVQVLSIEHQDSPNEITLETNDGRVHLVAGESGAFAKVYGPGLPTYSESRMMPGDSPFLDGCEGIRSFLLALFAEGVRDQKKLENAVNTALESLSNELA